MAASGKLDLVRGDSHLAGNLLDGSLEGPLRIDEHDRPQASLGYRQGQLHGASTLFHPNGRSPRNSPSSTASCTGRPVSMPRKAGCSARRTTATGCSTAKRSTISPTARWPSASITATAYATGSTNASMAMANWPSTDAT